MTKEEIILSMESAINERTILVRIFVGTLKQAVKLLKSQPEIVRCKDCRFGVERLDALRSECVECHRYSSWYSHDFDHFCSDGERKGR